MLFRSNNWYSWEIKTNNSVPAYRQVINKQNTSLLNFLQHYINSLGHKGSTWGLEGGMYHSNMEKERKCSWSIKLQRDINKLNPLQDCYEYHLSTLIFILRNPVKPSLVLEKVLDVMMLYTCSSNCKKIASTT